MASQESEESVDEDDVCAHRIGVLMAPVKREDVRANVVRSRIGDRSIDLRVVAGHSVHVVLAFLPLALLWVLMKSSPPLPIIIIWVLMKSSPRLASAAFRCRYKDMAGPKDMMGPKVPSNFKSISTLSIS